MARITVEDCLEKVDNRFHLVRVASKRARQLMNGKEPSLEWDNDKATVVALREIAAGNITEEMLVETPIVSEDEGIFDQAEIDAEISALLSDGAQLETQAEEQVNAEAQPEQEVKTAEAENDNADLSVAVQEELESTEN